MKISRQRTIKATPKAVWKAIAPVESVPKWLTSAEAAIHVSGPEAGKGRRQRITRVIYNRTVEIDQEVVQWEPGQRLEMLHVRETTGGRELTGVQHFRTAILLSPAGTGTRVRAQYSWDARFGLPLLFSILFGGRIMGRELKQTLAKINDLVAG